MSEAQDLNLNGFEDHSGSVQWKAFSLTHVEYPGGDIVGLILAVISLLPICVIVGFVTLILFRRDIHTIFFFIGVVISEGLNMVMKKIIAHPRPQLKSTLYTEYGMPSSHAQLSWFFATYCILFIVFRLRHNQESSVELCWKSIVVAGLSATASLVTYSRVYLLYHYWSQVLCGFVVGVFLGGFWFLVVHLICTPFFPTIASWEVSEFLMIRDTSLIPNILWFEYTHARAENRSRNRKLVSMKSQ